jgi:hypothetical protein
MLRQLPKQNVNSTYRFTVNFDELENEATIKQRQTIVDKKCQTQVQVPHSDVLQRK